MTGPRTQTFPHVIVVVMGVSGSGKTTVAAMLAGRLHWPFVESDDLHSPANIAKMHSGIPLDDDDRLPWLQAIAKEIDRWRAERRYGVIACSALKRRYRDIIIGERPDVQLVYLCGDRSLIAKRLAARQGHFMPKQLLENQFETLEEPAPEERAITIWVGRPPSMLVDEIVAALRARANALSPKEIIRSPRGSQRPPSGFRWSRKR
jgi:gluconokinase